MVRISDKEILRMLIEDGRRSFVDMGKALGVGESTVRKRVRSLEKKGIIRGYHADVDPKALGYSIDTLIGVDTTPERYLHIIEWLKKKDEVLCLWTSTGDHMIMFRGWFKDRDDLYKFISTLESMDGVTKVCPAILMEKIKKC